MSLGQAFIKYRELSSQLNDDRKVLTKAADSFGKLEKNKKEIFPQDVDGAIKRLGETKMHREQMQDFYREAGWKGKVVRFVNFFIGNAFAVSKTDAALKKVEPKLDELSKKTHRIWVKASTTTSTKTPSSTKSSTPASLLSQTRKPAEASPYTKYASIFKDSEKFTMLADGLAKTKTERELKNFEINLNKLSDHANKMREEVPDYALAFDRKAIEELFNPPFKDVREVTREFEKLFEEPKDFLREMGGITKNIPDKTKLRENIEDKLLYLQQSGINPSGLRGNTDLDSEFAKFLVSDKPPREILGHLGNYNQYETELLLKESEDLLKEQAGFIGTKLENADERMKKVDEELQDTDERLEEIKKALADLDKREAELEQAKNAASDLEQQANYYLLAREGGFKAQKPEEEEEEVIFSENEINMLSEETPETEVRNVENEVPPTVIINRLSKAIARTTETNSVRRLYDLIHTKATRRGRQEANLQELKNCHKCLEFFEKMFGKNARLVLSDDEDKTSDFIDFLFAGDPSGFPMLVEKEKESEGVNKLYHLR